MVLNKLSFEILNINDFEARESAYIYVYKIHKFMMRDVFFFFDVRM